MADDFRDWIGRTERVADPLPVTQALSAQATLDEPGPPLADGDPLPLPWHWFHFLPRAPQGRLGEDGHPERGGFLPPVPYPRRMFAGARLVVHRPLVIGTPAVREGTIADVQSKQGKSGALAFVTVRYRVLQHDALCLEEEQDIVYREPGAPLAAPPAGAWPPLAPGAWAREVRPDSRLLFRFSALTFNAHRIHYDRDYARDVEGYPALVVHGPLTAALLAQLVRRACGAPIVRFAFRGVAPVFDLGPVRLAAQREGDTVTLEARGHDGAVGLTATATLAPSAAG